MTPTLEEVLAKARDEMRREGKKQAMRDFADIITKDQKGMHELKETVRDLNDINASMVLLAIAVRRAKHCKIGEQLLGLWCSGYTTELLVQVRVELRLDSIERKGNANG